MFDLSQAIHEWREELAGEGLDRGTIEELESHLRDHIEHRVENGLSEEEAFSEAGAQIGATDEVCREFAKVSPNRFIVWTIARFRNLDLPLLLGLFLVCGMGLAMQYSVGSSAGEESIYVGFWLKQAVWMGLGFTLLFIVAQLTPARLKRLTPVIYGAFIILLILVLVTGIQVNGARSWFRLGCLVFQPSVLMLVTVPMMTAWLLSKQEWAKTWKGFTVMLSLILLPTLLIMGQPDMGMALLCLGAGWVTLFLSTSCRRRLVTLTFAALPVIGAAGWFLLKPYQLKGIQVFLNPEADPSGAGWRYLQIQEAVSSGGFWGRGWLNMETPVPEKHADFILSVVAEEFGTFGILALLACFGFVLYRAVVISRRSQESFGRLLGLGFAGLVGLQIVIQIGMLYGMVPVMGIPLPLVGYEGSALVILLVGFGILSSLQRWEEEERLCD